MVRWIQKTVPSCTEPWAVGIHSTHIPQTSPSYLSSPLVSEATPIHIRFFNFSLSLQTFSFHHFKITHKRQPFPCPLPQTNFKYFSRQKTVFITFMYKFFCEHVFISSTQIWPTDFWQRCKGNLMEYSFP